MFDVCVMCTIVLGEISSECMCVCEVRAGHVIKCDTCVCCKCIVLQEFWSGMFVFVYG